MLVKCLNLYHSVISTGFVTNRHALLASTLQTDRQIKLDGNLIQFTLLNWFKLIRLMNQLFLALLEAQSV